MFESWLEQEKAAIEARFKRVRILCVVIAELVLTKENYYVGNRGHMRWCFALALYTSDDEKPVWKGYFMNPKKPWWKSLLEWIPVLLFLALMIYFAKFLNT